MSSSSQAPHPAHAGPPATSAAKPTKRKPRPALWPEVREHQIMMIESVYQRDFEDAQERWERVLKEMRLEVWHYIPARLVIDAGGWRDKNHPYAWVASVTKRKAKRLQLADHKSEELQVTPVGGRTIADTTDYLSQDISISRNGVWKAHTRHDDIEEPQAMDNVDWVWVRPDAPRGFTVDWSAVGQAAGLSQIETQILELRSLGLSRSEVLATCDTDAERLEMQAAWRGVCRKMPVVRDILRTHKKPDE
ncbi:MAG: hypothetical protein IT165_06615 [Bryobacterales bacterium]|nr:hypothetical protein [Bryobacterales bacterium]